VTSNLLDEFVELLSQLPPATWKATLTEGSAGWKWMQPFSNTWVFGHFAALFIILGLNDYQLKGKAEVAYWPKVVPLIPLNSDPEEPLKLIGLLEPFYEQERMAKAKVERLHRFLSSKFCSKIWGSNAASIAAGFERIWYALGRTMNQPPEKKTIAFAMKCLALALLMVNETMFDFGAIPVPVDSRILTISTRLGLPHVNEQAERERWQQVLERIRKVNPKVTMVHLDSLLWQIGTLSKDEMLTHLVTLGAGSLAARITEMVR
jgi:DNA-(apurinic or apyrimidinic site) lyase